MFTFSRTWARLSIRPFKKRSPIVHFHGPIGNVPWDSSVSRSGMYYIHTNGTLSKPRFFDLDKFPLSEEKTAPLANQMSELLLFRGCTSTPQISARASRLYHWLCNLAARQIMLPATSRVSGWSRTPCSCTNSTSPNNENLRYQWFWSYSFSSEKSFGVSADNALERRGIGQDFGLVYLRADQNSCPK